MNDDRILRGARARRLRRSAALTAAFGAGAYVLARASAEAAPDHIESVLRVDELLVPGMLGLAAGLLGWLACCSLVNVLAATPGVVGSTADRVARRITPALVRRALGIVVVGALGTGAAPPLALAADQPVPVVTVVTAQAITAQTVIDPAFTPTDTRTDTHTDTRTNTPSDTPVTTEAPVPIPDFVPTPPVRVTPVDTLLVPAPRIVVADSIVVQRGDTLWSIAARHLGLTGTEADITHEWHAWYDTNRATIGPNPDLILPGMRLVAPDRVAGHTGVRR